VFLHPPHSKLGWAKNQELSFSSPMTFSHKFFPISQPRTSSMVVIQKADSPWCLGDFFWLLSHWSGRDHVQVRERLVSGAFLLQILELARGSGYHRLVRSVHRPSSCSCFPLSQSPKGGCSFFHMWNDSTGLTQSTHLVQEIYLSSSCLQVSFQTTHRGALGNLVPGRMDKVQRALSLFQGRGASSTPSTLASL